MRIDPGYSSSLFFRIFSTASQQRVEGKSNENARQVTAGVK